MRWASVQNLNFGSEFEFSASTLEVKNSRIQKLQLVRSALELGSQPAQVTRFFARPSPVT